MKPTALPEVEPDRQGRCGVRGGPEPVGFGREHIQEHQGIGRAQPDPGRIPRRVGRLNQHAVITDPDRHPLVHR